MQQDNKPYAPQENKSGDRKLEQEKMREKNETDTAPDEFIAPNADTDQPLDDKGIVNDAVLGGEDHVNELPEKKPEERKK